MTDIWISFANDEYISLTVHFIDECWDYTFANYPFLEQHIGDNIVEKLKEVVGEYEIADSTIFAVMHDQGSNFHHAGHLLEADIQWNSSETMSYISTILPILFGILKVEKRDSVSIQRFEISAVSQITSG